MTTPEPSNLREALVSARHCMAFSSQDWSASAARGSLKTIRLRL